MVTLLILNYFFKLNKINFLTKRKISEVKYIICSKLSTPIILLQIVYPVSGK